jgi:hypothetical protein
LAAEFTWVTTFVTTYLLDQSSRTG